MQNDPSRPPLTGRGATPRWRPAAATLAITLTMTLAVAVTIAASAPQSAPQVDRQGATGEGEPAPMTPRDRLREGTRIADRLGTFTRTAKQLVFQTSDGKLQLGGLPNLNLERVARTLQDSQTGLIWSVSGIVTEYHGGNYLLITRAVLKSTQPTRLSPLGRRNSGAERLPRARPGRKPATQQTAPPRDRSALRRPLPRGTPLTGLGAERPRASRRSYARQSVGPTSLADEYPLSGDSSYPRTSLTAFLHRDTRTK